MAQRTADLNASAIHKSGGSILCAQLDWAWPHGLADIPYGICDLVVGSELVYDTASARALPRVVAGLLAPSRGRFLCVLGVREPVMFDAFLTSAYAAGLELTYEPQVLCPSPEALRIAKQYHHDIEISSSAHAWKGYIKIEMTLSSQPTS